MLNKVKGKLIVSCQALDDEPLHSSFIMGRMAKAAKEGGAVAIRAQGVEDIIEIINRNKHDIEIIMTGRDVPKELADRADLITEMNMVKHYYEKGVPAREGIEY